MAPEVSPAFQLYVKEWRSSRAVMRMTAAQRGMYLEMLLEQWENYTLADCPQGVHEATGSFTLGEWKRAWPVLRRKFVTDDAGRIYNVRLQQERQKQKSRRKSSEQGGRARVDSPRDGGGRFQPTHQPVTSQPTSREPAISQPASSLSFALPIALPVSLPVAGNGGVSAGSARSKHPVFKGQRFVVFEWQLEDLMRLLGPLTDDFDLHAWFFELDRRAMQTGQVVPQKDGGAWLQAQTVAEAQRRGLPVAAAVSPLGKGTQKLVNALAELSDAV